MSAHVLLNLLNEFQEEKEINRKASGAFYLFFPSLKNSIIQEHKF